VAASLSIPPSHAVDVHTVQGDISQVETAQRIVEETLDRFGRIDTLVNNAGIFIGKPFLDYTYDDFAVMTAVNLDGFFHLTQRVVRHMAKQSRGHVVNITTSLVDHARVASPSALASLTKGGLDAVTRSLATEFAARGVRVNAVAPGVVKTPATADTDYEELAAQHPLGRMAEIGDIVEGVIYLEQATFVTGETLHIDGGQAAGH
jgi:NAD(P)-dependent dehydrogenase (short-subunit alcohol dehydrogenase family)